MRAGDADGGGEDPVGWYRERHSAAPCAAKTEKIVSPGNTRRRAVAAAVDGWAGALVALAETVVADRLRPGRGPNRHTVILHADAAAPWAGEAETVADAAERSPGLGRRRPGDGLGDGAAADVRLIAGLCPRRRRRGGRQRQPPGPSVPAARARAVNWRDQYCVFPTRDRHLFVEVRPVRHRADQGENTMASCACLGPMHHHLLHEGGLTMTTPRRDASSSTGPPVPDGDRAVP